MPRPDYTLPLDQLPDPLPIEPLTKPFDVTITPPGSKSITCRAYVLAALAKGESKLIRPLRADDTDLLLKALCTLGAEARWEGEDAYIKGVNGRFPRGGSVNLGDGGTPTRFMIACACLAAEPVTVDGSKRMRERPIAEGVELLRRLGAKIEYVEAERRLPVRVTPAALRGGRFEIPKLESSQFVSAMMLIAPQVPSGLELSFSDDATSASYINLTFGVLCDWNATTDEDVDHASWNPAGGFRHEESTRVVRISPSSVSSRTYEIEPDASSAIYWLAEAAVGPIGSRVVVPSLSSASAQPDAWLLYLLAQSGADIRCFDELENPPRTEVVSRSGLTAQKFSGAHSPDGSMMFAVLSAVSQGIAHICELGTLRVKETDRIAALANELRKVGCEVAAGEDWIEITPPEKGGTGVSPVSGRPGTGEVLERRSRNLPHWELGGSTYFITFRVRDGELSHEERRIVARASRYWHDKRMTLHLGVVMHDHVHLLLTPLRSGIDADGRPRYHALSDLLHSIKSFTAHEIQSRRKASGPFWQEESYDRIMRDDNEYLEKWNYMLNNPAEAGLVKRGEPYEHFVRGSMDTGETPVPPSSITGEKPVVIETYNDHRMAMAFAVLGLAAPNGHRLAIRNPACVAKSYPTFWKDFAKLYQ